MARSRATHERYKRRFTSGTVAFSTVRHAEFTLFEGSALMRFRAGDIQHSSGGVGTMSGKVTFDVGRSKGHVEPKVTVLVASNRNQSRFQVLSVRGIYVSTKIQHGHFSPRIPLRLLAHRGAKFDSGLWSSDVFRD